MGKINQFMSLCMWTLALCSCICLGWSRQNSYSRWAICDTASLSAAQKGLSPGWAFRGDSKHFTKADIHSDKGLDHRNGVDRKSYWLHRVPYG